MGRGREEKGEEGRGEGKGKVVPNVRDALTPLLKIIPLGIARGRTSDLSETPTSQSYYTEFPVTVTKRRNPRQDSENQVLSRKNPGPMTVTLVRSDATERNGGRSRPRGNGVSSRPYTGGRYRRSPSVISGAWASAGDGHPTRTSVGISVVGGGGGDARSNDRCHSSSSSSSRRRCISLSHLRRAIADRRRLTRCNRFLARSQ